MFTTLLNETFFLPWIKKASSKLKKPINNKIRIKDIKMLWCHIANNIAVATTSAVDSTALQITDKIYFHSPLLAMFLLIKNRIKIYPERKPIIHQMKKTIIATPIWFAKSLTRFAIWALKVSKSVPNNVCKVSVRIRLIQSVDNIVLSALLGLFQSNEVIFDHNVFQTSLKSKFKFFPKAGLLYTSTSPRD